MAHQNREMFDHLLSKSGRVFWVYGGHTCKMYPIRHLEFRNNPDDTATKGALQVPAHTRRPTAAAVSVRGCWCWLIALCVAAYRGRRAPRAAEEPHRKAVHPPPVRR